MYSTNLTNNPESFQDDAENFFYSAYSLLESTEKEIPFLVESLFPRSGLVAIAGSSDLGKSILARQFAISIVAGHESFLGRRLNIRYNKAIYVSTEDGKDATASLIRHAISNGCARIETLHNLGIYLSNEHVLERLGGELTRNKVDLIVIDAFLDVFEEADLNSARSMRKVLQPYYQLAAKYDTLLLFIHHSGKQSGAPNKNNLLGSQAFEARMRCVIELTGNPTSYTRKAHIVKGNYLPPEQKKKGIDLELRGSWFFAEGQRSVEDNEREAKNSLREQVTALNAEGLRQKDIALRLGCNKTTVSKYLRDSKVSKFPSESFRKLMETTNGNNKVSIV